LQSQLAQRRDIDNMQPSSEPLPRLSPNELQPKADDDDTKRREAFYNAAERFSARCDQNEQKGLLPSKTTKRGHEDEQLHHSLVEKSSALTHKKAKGKAPTRTQPSRTKAIPSATAFHRPTPNPEQQTIW
jgi:hypothetical protein